MALNESLNAKSAFEVYRKIQLSKFPTVSSNLRQFLRFKKHDVAQTPKLRDTYLSLEKNGEERRSSSMRQQRKVPFSKTQNIPQSLQKRVKTAMF